MLFSISDDKFFIAKFHTFSSIDLSIKSRKFL